MATEDNLDPFTTVYNRLWDIFEQSAELTSLVKLRNRIRRTGVEFIRDKDEKTPVDFPELDLVPAGGTLQIPATSTSNAITQGFEIVINSDKARLDVKFFPVIWAVLKAINKAGCDMGIPELVARIELSNYTDDENLAALLKGMEGWSSLITANIEMRIDKKFMI